LNWFDLFVTLFFLGALCFYLAGTSQAEEIDMAISGVLTTLRYAVPIARLLKWIREKARAAAEPELDVGTVDFHQIALGQDDDERSGDALEDGYGASFAPAFAGGIGEGAALWGGSVQSALSASSVVERIESRMRIRTRGESIDALLSHGEASNAPVRAPSPLTRAASRARRATPPATPPDSESPSATPPGTPPRSPRDAP
jgi:hypothetical protein